MAVSSAVVLAVACALTATVPAAAQGADARSAAGDLRDVPFDRLHGPAAAADGGALVFGGLTSSGQPRNARARLLGRWEGYDLALPVPRDWKLVVFVEAIRGDRASIAIWAGTNLQRPRVAKRCSAEIGGKAPVPVPVLTWRARLDGTKRTFSFRYDPATDRLLGSIAIAVPGASPAVESVVLTRDRTFLVYPDYPAYLARKRIGVHEHGDPALWRFGRGYLVYLPPGYEESPQQRWPLILFFCGSGDRGAPVEDLAKASPFMFIRERGDLPAVIVAPALNDSPRHASFPTEYMRGVLDEVLARYRIDPSRVLLTGLSMGGEAVIRFALTSPERIAAAAPISMADPRFDRGLQLNGYEVTDLPYERAASVPFYVVSGGRDPWIRPDAVRRTVEALRAAGVATEWKVLADNGHDTWTDTYSDPAFYGWLLSKHR